MEKDLHPGRLISNTSGSGSSLSIPVLASRMDKPLALLIPGLDGTGKLYFRQIEALSKSYRTLAWQFRNRDSFNLPDLVEEVAQGTENEKPGSMLLVGESFGGMVALQFALSHPERVQRLVLINAFPYYRQKTRISLACLLSGLLQKPLARGVKDFVVERILTSEGIQAPDRLLYREAIRLVCHPAYCRRLQLVRDVDLRGRLGEINTPTCFFASGRDKLVHSIREARFMYSVIPGAKGIYEFPHAGHALLLTPGFSLAAYLLK
jgi:3-oxoadipate enol-lactonase